MALRREPSDANVPFDHVTDELGHQHLQCTMCGGHNHMVDRLAADFLRARPLGFVRLASLAPWVAAGMIRFMLRHLHCITEHRRR